MIAAVVLLAAGAAAGAFGSLLGLGGGILIVPLLTLGFGRPLREAVAVSLVSVIVTSSASAGVYLERHVANLRLGLVLEAFTAAGALAGGLVAFLLDERVLSGLFAALLAWVAVAMVRGWGGEPTTIDNPGSETVAAGGAGAGPGPAERDPSDEARPGVGGFRSRLAGPGYRVSRLGAGVAGSLFAGLVSALLGIGGGIIKVPVMHLVMGVPLRIATATSNMMIGITATSSAVIYLLRGGIDPYVAGPTALGVFAGASFGARIAHRVDGRLLRLLFVVVLAYTALQMARRALAL